MNFDKTLQVKQFVACVKGHDEYGETGRFMVLETGDDKFYLFHKLDPATGCTTGISFPVRKSDLRDDVRRALAHGYGNCGMRASDDGVPFRFLPPGATWRPTEEAPPPMTPDDPLAPLCAAVGAYQSARLARAAAEERSDEAQRALDAAREDERRARAAVEALRAPAAPAAPSPEGAFTSPEILAGRNAADERAAAAAPVEPPKPRRPRKKAADGPAVAQEFREACAATSAASQAFIDDPAEPESFAKDDARTNAAAMRVAVRTIGAIEAGTLAEPSAADAPVPDAALEAPVPQQRPADARGELFAGREGGPC